jgi:hypothetical protein
MVNLDKAGFYLPFPTTTNTASQLASIIHSTHYAKMEKGSSSVKFEGDCWSCHEIDPGMNFKLLGLNKSLIEQTSKEEINKMKPYYQSWASSSYLDHTHFLNEVDCKMCHGEIFPYNRPAKQQCFECHISYQELAILTQDREVLNPHFSHIGEVRCSLCHYAHQKSRDYCNRCHDDIHFEVP